MIKTVSMLLEGTFNEASAPLFKKVEDEYIISSKDGAEFSAGMYCGKIDVSDCPEGLLKMSVSVETMGDSTYPQVLAFFKDSDGNLLQSDYFRKNGKKFVLKTEIPQGAKTLGLELRFTCYGKGSVTYSNPSVEITEKEPHRIVRVASAFIDKKGNFEDNLKNTLAVIEKAGNSLEKPDILCFTECVLDLSCKDRFYITEDGNEMALVKEATKKAGMYVIFTSHEIDEKLYRYNTSFLIDPKGEIVGKYRKVFLTGSGEYRGGMTPGRDFPVFETSFGKIGMMICWDQWFPEGARELCRKGAEIIFWSTRGFHEPRAVTRAMDNGVYFAVSHSNPENCGIIEPAWGKFIARADKTEVQGFVSAEIDLDERLISQYKSFGSNGANDRDLVVAESGIIL